MLESVAKLVVGQTIAPTCSVLRTLAAWTPLLCVYSGLASVRLGIRRSVYDQSIPTAVHTAREDSYLSKFSSIFDHSKALFSIMEGGTISEKLPDSWAPCARSALVSSADDEYNSEEERGLLQTTTTIKKSKTWFSTTTLSIACGVLLAIIAVQVAIMISFGIRIASGPPAQSQLGLSNLRNQTRVAGIPSRFWDFDELDKSNEAWEGIRAGHGVVALTPEFVAAHNLPETINHPEDSSKKVYAIESYHMIHCLQWLRRGYVALRQGGTDEDHPLEHILHCFDALRQSIMCQANDELLTITGHGHSRGYNQTRQCRSWDALRDFATANEACYYDARDDKSSSWSKCDNGNDGLPVGNLW